MTQNQSTASLAWTRVEKKPPKNVIVQSSSKSTQNHYQSPLQIEAERNLKDQQKIDKEVLVSGFLSQPEANHWKKLIEIAGIDMKKVENHGSFNGQNGRFFLTIGFKDKVSQKLFVKVINGKYLKIFDEAKKKTTILIAQCRLTKFNSNVEKELRELFNAYAIAGYRLEGFLYKATIVYENNSSPSTLIDTQQALKKFIAEATQTKKIDNRAEKQKNLQAQQALDRNISIHGFISKPQKIEDIIGKFMDRFDLSFDHITSYRMEEIKNNWTIFIQLSEKSAQRKILQVKIKNRKIRLSNLMGNKAGDLVDPVITWQRALTNFNEEVNEKLAKAVNDRKIEKFEFAEHRFRAKVDQSSPWVVIECQSDLDSILKPKKQQVQKTVRKTSLYKVNSVESMSTSMSVMSVSSGSRIVE